MDKERFSLLLLEPGEIYFEDFSAVLIPNDASKRQDGRLKLCSRSIVFDPKDILSPLLKIPLKECTVIEELRESLALKLEGKGGITLECNHHVQMLEGNIVAPYTFKFEKQRFNFLLNYARASNCLAQFAQLHRASSLPIAEQNTMLAAITFSRQSRMVFDSLWLDDLYEQRVFETQGHRITPLVVNPGHILLTNEVLYYQPFNNVETLPVVKIRLKDVRRVVKRRFLLQHVGLEVYCCDGSPVPHLFLALKSVDERDKLYNGLLAQCGPYLDDSKQEAITLKWQHGVLSNYDYILYLNSLADRTFNDLTQYPVFPWVVADYQSSKLDLNAFKTFRDLRKPIGALNEERLKKLRDRYDEMPEPKFMYGSHYSTPGFVLFYLVRKFPHYMLCLQNGRFDHPDRMFNSVPDVWRNVLGNPSDFKELVPEFYDIQGGGDFLTNTFGINFGYRHDGTKVGNVALPPWAAGPADFVQKLRDALESDYVSENLHSWIDLIFGYKQTGEEAIKANNVFYHLCYEGSVDLSTVTDPARRHALEVQIMEFGQIPRQILDCPHPKRIIHRPNAGLAVCAVSGPMSNEGGGDQPKQFEYVVAFSGHRECVRAVNILEAGQAVASVGNDGLLKVHSLVEHRLLHSVALATTPLSSVVPLPGHHRVAAGSFDNSVVFYDLQFGRILDRLVAHEDAVSCLAWGSKSATNDSLLVTGSWDCSARVWRKIPIGDSEWRPIRPANTLAAELDHDARVVCLAISSDEKYLVTGCEDGGLFLWFLDTHSLYQTLPGHLGPVGAVAIGNNVQQLVSCGVSDRTLKVFDIPSGMPVCCKELNQDLRCLAWVGPAVLVGGSAGMLQVWDLLHVEIVQEISAHKGAVTAVAMSSDGSILVTGGEDCQVIVWK